jgi:uncharacterized protein Usg
VLFEAKLQTFVLDWQAYGVANREFVLSIDLQWVLQRPDGDLRGVAYALRQL